jgi:hypothetical protein
VAGAGGGDSRWTDELDPEDAVPPRYEIRLDDRHGLPAADQFPDVEVSRNGSALLLRGELDQSALHGVLERARALRLDLLDVRRSRSSSRPSYDVRATIGGGPATGP